MSRWYPDWDFYRDTHQRMIDEFGGFHGYIMYAEAAFNSVTKPIKKIPDLYKAAGELLYQLYHTRLVEDGRRRTAFTVTASFLMMNGAAPYETDLERIIVFMRQDIVHCNSKDCAEWLKNGKKYEP